MRRWRPTLFITALVVLAVASYAPAPAAASTLTSNTTATLSLAGGETLTVSGNLQATIQNFNVNDDSIVVVARVSGTLSAGTVVATFTNVKIVAAIRNLEASCASGTLSFSFRVTIPTKGISVTVGGVPVSLRGAVTLRGSVVISTADIADPELAAAVGELICQIETLLETGASLDAVVAELNTVLSTLP
jgi:hypothetical protein